MNYEKLEKILKTRYPKVIPPQKLLELKKPILQLDDEIKSAKSGKFDSRNLDDENIKLLLEKRVEAVKKLFSHLNIDRLQSSKTGVKFELNIPTSPPLGIFYGLGLILVIHKEVKDKIRVTEEMRTDLYRCAESLAIHLSQYTNPRPESARLIKNLKGLQTRPWEHQFIFLPAPYGDHIGYPVFRGKEKTVEKMNQVFDCHLNGKVIEGVPAPLEKWLIKQIEQPE